MLIDLVKRLECPSCLIGKRLQPRIFAKDPCGHIQDGVLICGDCGAWYTIDDQLLELVPSALVDPHDLARFAARWCRQIREIGLKPPTHVAGDSFALQLKQREHFDWYADNGQQNYLDYAATPFWTAVDDVTFGAWRSEIRHGKWLLDIGCANGRSAFPMAESGVTVVGCDISKKMIRQAIEQAKRRGLTASTSFFVADGNALPLAECSFDYAMTYGVLHHLPDPGSTCQRIQRILKPGGIFFGSENNQTIFRRVFDLLMKLKPLWTEEAGREPLISRKMLDDWHSGQAVLIRSATSVFAPPHLLNLVGRDAARRLLAFTDAVCSAVPGMAGQGGLIVFEIHKLAQRLSDSGRTQRINSNRTAAAA
jgi:2-polyprenyl-3-methyl-5-hydroxy-6-metoxy-1,4-benzoquinol methylase